jgi:hypothetical protein
VASGQWAVAGFEATEVRSQTQSVEKSSTGHRPLTTDH